MLEEVTTLLTDKTISPQGPSSLQKFRFLFLWVPWGGLVHVGLKVETECSFWTSKTAQTCQHGREELISEDSHDRHSKWALDVDKMFTPPTGGWQDLHGLYNKPSGGAAEPPPHFDFKMCVAGMVRGETETFNQRGRWKHWSAWRYVTL